MTYLKDPPAELQMIDENGLVNSAWLEWFTNVKNRTKISRVRVTKDDAQSISDSTWTKVEYDDEDYDTLNEYDNSTNYRFTATKNGYYFIMASLVMDNVAWAAGDIAQIKVNKNTTDTMRNYHEVEANSTKYIHLRTSDVLYLAIDDYIEAYIYHTRGSATNVYGSALYNILTIHRLI